MAIPIILGDRVLDAGLAALDTECNAIYVCHTQPMDYAQATSTYALGSKAIAAGSVFGAPLDNSTTGRKVISIAVDNGGNSASGTPAAWAAVDTVNLRFLASGPLTGGVPFASGVFDLTALTVIQPYTFIGLPESLTAPLVIGTVADLSELSSDTGTWETEDPTTYTYQWYAALADDAGSVLLDDDGHAVGMLIFGARSSTYTIGGIPVAPESTWNEADVTLNASSQPTLTFSNNNLTVTANPNGCTRGTQARSAGKRYFEITIDQVNNLYTAFPGIADDSHVLQIGVYPGQSNAKGSCIYINGPSGSCYINVNTGVGGANPPVSQWLVGDVCGVACDLGTRRIWYSRNGVWLGGGGNLAASEPGYYWGTAALPAMKPYAEVNTVDGLIGKVTLNTGATPFAYTLPTGFVMWEAP